MVARQGPEMHRIQVFAATALVLSSCVDLQLPARPPPPGPGTIQGTLVYSVPGRSGYRPAVGATASILSTGLSASVDDQGRFLLAGVTQTSGVLHLTFDQDGDGVAERQKVLNLETLGAGPGRDLALGEVVLSRNAVARGRVTLEDVGSSAGLGGIAVFVPGAPWSSYTADDGSYALEGLPEGLLQVAFFMAGYEVGSLDTELSAGEDKQLSSVQLMKSTGGAAALRGQVMTAGLTPANDAQVRLRFLGVEQTLSVDEQGQFTASPLATGLYQLAIERTGSLSITLYNLLLQSGETDLGRLVMADGPSSMVMLGGLGPYLPSDGGMDGGMDPSFDGGIGPVAQATAPQLATPGTQVTLSGMSSTGDFPLIYRWTQLGGTPVTLNTNNTALAHSPRFTAPAAGTILEFQLEVEDRRGVLSAPARVSVGIGVTPIASFKPDAGLVYAGQLVSLFSTSVDDAGVALVSFDWQLAAGSQGMLIADGGPTALWRTPALAVGAPDTVGAVSLRVANAIGARSGLTTQFYTVRAANSNNWSLDAGAALNVSVGAVAPLVQLSASVSSTLINPLYTVNWVCPAPIALVAGDTLNARFLAPSVVGPTQTFSCQVQAMGQPPLDPPVLTSAVNLFLRDTAPPTVSASSVEATRMSRFGFIITASEPLEAATPSFSCSPSQAYGFGTRIIHKSLIAGTAYTPLGEGSTCGNFQVDMTDTAQFANTVTNAAFAPPASVTVQTVWNGPYESTALFDDPRPVVATLTQLPREIQERAGLAPGTVPGFELVATESGNLVRLSGLDLASRPSCEPSCALNASQEALGLGADSIPGTARVNVGGAELFVSTSTDGGIAPIVARRSPAGVWSRFNGMTGTPGTWAAGLRTVRFDSSLGQILVDTWNPAPSSFTTTDLVATGLTDVALVATAENYVVAAVGPNRQMLVRRRNADLSWSTVTLGASPQNITSLMVHPLSSGVVLAANEQSGGSFNLQRIDSGGSSLISSVPVTGFDVASWGGHTYIVYGLNGDIRLKTIAASFWSGAGGGPVDFGGPPRSGFMSPYPVVLDADPLCEAAWPQMSFVEEALVITWQERCSPSMRWKVVARTVR